MIIARSTAAGIAAACIAGALPLSGCAPVMVASAVTQTVLIATDRRSVGAQADDEAIELKIATQVNNRTRRKRGNRGAAA